MNRIFRIAKLYPVKNGKTCLTTGNNGNEFTIYLNDHSKRHKEDCAIQLLIMGDKNYTITILLDNKPILRSTDGAAVINLMGKHKCFRIPTKG